MTIRAIGISLYRESNHQTGCVSLKAVSSRYAVQPGPERKKSLKMLPGDLATARPWPTVRKPARRPAQTLIRSIRRGNRTLMATKKKPATKKAATKPTAPKPIKDVMSKSALVAHIASATDVAAKDVRAIMAALEGAIHASVGKKGAGMFVLPGLLKITAVSVAAKPKRKGINPFTGQETTFAAKPATVKVKVRPMKKLKDAATA
jgi:nucleoid DNA-binding protein